MTSQEKRGGIKKIRPVREEETRHVISPGASCSVPFIFRSAKDAGKEPSCQKKASFRQKVLSCLILGSELKRDERWACKPSQINCLDAGSSRNSRIKM